MRPLYVLDTETTGLLGAEGGDKVVEIGIARVDLELGRVYPEYGRIIRQQLTEEQKCSWVFEHTDLKPSEVSRSPYRPSDIMTDLKLQFEDGVFTAYNVAFDFGMFLSKDPYDWHPHLAPCIMETAREMLGVERWLRAQDAYDTFCKGNPANVPNGIEEHRALSDAVFEGHILLGMIEAYEGLYDTYAEVLE